MREGHAVDNHNSRLELARELGATHTTNTKDVDLAEEILRITGGRGADYIVDTTARPELLRQAADSLALRGTLVLVGAAAPGTEVSFEIGLSLVEGLTFQTVVQGSSVHFRSSSACGAEAGSPWPGSVNSHGF
jgi:aryl-alcohol dehydrogenase